MIAVKIYMKFQFNTMKNVSGIEVENKNSKKNKFWHTLLKYTQIMLQNITVMKNR